ncbi:hypothetical protein RDI58_025420 [Solanum bulbocastanum]|uniref:Uncharacterized protein n=1 Tax=Solanum bulbocastanum TaxID=147425 RepID=A0AAN8T454_SOLBU
MHITLWHWTLMSLFLAVFLKPKKKMKPLISREVRRKLLNYMARSYPWMLFKNLANTLGTDGTKWTLDSFMESFSKELKSYPLNQSIDSRIVIVAYRTGLAINTDVTVKEAEEGLSEVLCGGNAVRELP